MQVTEELVGAPSPDKADAVAVDARAHEGHGPSCSRRPCRHVLGSIPRMWVDGEGGANSTSEIRGLDVPKRKSRLVAVRIDGRRRVGGDCPQVDNSIDQAENRVKVWVAGAAVPDGLIAHATFLTRECQGDKSGGVEVGDGAVQVIK